MSRFGIKTLPYPSSFPLLSFLPRPLLLIFLRQPYVLPYRRGLPASDPLPGRTNPEDKPGGPPLITPASHPRRRLRVTVKRSCTRQPTGAAEGSRTGGCLYFANRPLSCQTIVAWSPQSGMAQTPGCFQSWSAGTAEGSRRRGGGVPEVRTDKTAETFHCRS